MPPDPARATTFAPISAASETALRTSPLASPPAKLAGLAERLVRTVSVARALVAGGRAVDLSGFEDGVGLLCAKTLDLDGPEARHMLPDLLELAAQIDRMSVLLRETAAQAAPGEAAHARRAATWGH